PPLTAGDRILVAKVGYGKLERLQLVVFDFPVATRPEQGKIRYVKRLIGLPGETIAIHGGKFYVTTALDYQWRTEKPAGPSDPNARTSEYMDNDDSEARKRFEGDRADPKKRTFQIIRKSPGQILAVRQLVHDNDCVSVDLVGVQEPRWSTQPPWKANDPK